jgi:hypothetical protein
LMKGVGGCRGLLIQPGVVLGGCGCPAPRVCGRGCGGCLGGPKGAPTPPASPYRTRCAIARGEQVVRLSKPATIEGACLWCSRRKIGVLARTARA